MVLDKGSAALANTLEFEKAGVGCGVVPWAETNS
jgi:hypothetical protein